MKKLSQKSDLSSIEKELDLSEFFQDSLVSNLFCLAKSELTIQDNQ